MLSMHKGYFSSEVTVKKGYSLVVRFLIFSGLNLLMLHPSLVRFSFVLQGC